MVKEATLEKSQSTEIVEKFLQVFSKACDATASAPTAATLEQCIAKSFTIKRNGHVTAKNASEYLATIVKIRENYTSCKIASVGAPFASNSKVVVQFTAHFSGKQGKKKEFLIMACATVENGKITAWEEVAHENT